jgi:hypothetical protein
MCLVIGRFRAGSSAWYTDEMSGRRTFGSHRRSAWDDRKAAGSNPARSTKNRLDLTRRLARKRYPPGGSRIVNKKRKLKKKESKASAVGFDSGNYGVPIELGCSKDTGGAEEEHSLLIQI